MNHSIPSLLALILLLAGCATPTAIVPRESSVTDLRARMGTPTDIRFDRGNELWEYATGPTGMETWLFRVGPDGKIVESTQLLTSDRFQRITVGKTTKADVRDLLGRPSNQHFLGSGAVWEWRMREGATPGYYAVRFGPGNVVAEAMVLPDVSSGDGRGQESSK